MKYLLSSLLTLWSAPSASNCGLTVKYLGFDCATESDDCHMVRKVDMNRVAKALADKGYTQLFHQDFYFEKVATKYELAFSSGGLAGYRGNASAVLSDSSRSLVLFRIKKPLRLREGMMYQKLAKEIPACGVIQ